MWNVEPKVTLIVPVQANNAHPDRKNWRSAQSVLLSVSLMCGTACPIAARGTQNPQETEKILAQTREQMQRAVLQRTQTEQQRTQAIARLRAADARIAQSAQSLQKLQEDLQQQRTSLLQTQVQFSQVQAQLAHLRQILSQLLRDAYQNLYEGGRVHFFMQDNTSTAERMLVYQKSLQDAWLTRVATVSDQIAALQRTQDKMRAQEHDLEETEQHAKQEALVYQNDRQAQLAAVNALGAQYRTQREREDALREDASALEQLLARLRAQARIDALRQQQQRNAQKTHPGTANQPYVTGAGWPAVGQLAVRFGAALPNGGQSQGIVITAPQGTPVKVLASGEVVFADWMTGYGMLMIVDHGGGYMSLYAHNQTLRATLGSHVQSGQVIALVGQSGGEDVPGLYFELRYNGKPIDPMRWLKNSRQATP